MCRRPSRKCTAAVVGDVEAEREGRRVERMDRRAYSEREKEGVRERAMVLVYFDPCGTPERVHW